MSFSHMILALTFLPPLFTTAHNCSNEFSKEIANKFTTTPNCRKKTLGAEFAWVYKSNSRQLDIAFGARLKTETGWLAWGVNPIGPHMVGTRALIGIKHRNGSLEWGGYKISEATKRGCQLEPSANTGLNVSRIRFEYWERIQYYVILGSVSVPYEFEVSRTNVVWQIGEAASGNHPEMHPTSLDNLNSAQIFDFVANDLISYSRHRLGILRSAHGVLNIVGWGTLLPMGVIVARYSKTQRGFRFHVISQTAGYIVGSTGWALGIWLANSSKYYSFHTHHVLAIIIFTFTSIQMLAFWLRPKPEDEFRAYWNMYHHFLGYALLVLIWINIFVGIKILEPDHVWKWTYIGVVGLLGMVALVCEIFSWIQFLVKRIPTLKH